MFVQIIQGRTHDAAQLRDVVDRWHREVAPGARGWLGSTCGVTDEGLYIGLIRFASHEAAHRNSQRRAHAQWWSEMCQLFTGQVTVHDCADVETFGRGGSDEAGFVQIIQSRIRDRQGLHPFWTDAEERAMAELRPDTIGGLFCVHPDGGCTIAVYFTSEAAAREGERKEMPPELKAWRDQEMRHYTQAPVFHDIHEPWFYSPTRRWRWLERLTRPDVRRG